MQSTRKTNNQKAPNNPISPNMVKYQEMGCEVLTLSPNWEYWPNARDLEIIKMWEDRWNSNDDDDDGYLVADLED